MPWGAQKPCNLITSTGKKATIASSTWAVGGNMEDRTGKALQLEACLEVEVFGLGLQPMHMPCCELEFSAQPCALLFPYRKWDWSLC